jgi:hypothetical protein
MSYMFGLFTVSWSGFLWWRGLVIKVYLLHVHVCTNCAVAWLYVTGRSLGVCKPADLLGSRATDWRLPWLHVVGRALQDLHVPYMRL